MTLVRADNLTVGDIVAPNIDFPHKRFEITRIDREDPVKFFSVDQYDNVISFERHPHEEVYTLKKVV